MDLQHPDLTFILAAYAIAFFIYGYVIFRTVFQSKHLKRLLSTIKAGRHNAL